MRTATVADFGRLHPAFWIPFHFPCATGLVINFSNAECPPMWTVTGYFWAPQALADSADEENNDNLFSLQTVLATLDF